MATNIPDRDIAAKLVEQVDQLAEDRIVRNAEIVRLRAALEELLDVAERIRGGDTNLDPERWYAARDYARRHSLDIESVARLYSAKDE